MGVTVTFVWIDLAFVALAILGVVIGYRFGAVRALLLGVMLYLATLLSSSLASGISGFLENQIRFFENNPNLSEIIAYVFVYVAAVVIALALAFFIRSVLKLVLLGFVDRLLGVALGVVMSFVALGGLVIWVASGDFSFLGFGCESIAQTLLNSYVFNNIFDFVWVVFDWFVGGDVAESINSLVNHSGDGIPSLVCQA